MRVVVVGATGRTGKHIVSQLLKNGDEVVATIRDPKKMAALVKQGAETHILDLDTSPLADIEHAFKGAEAVVFAAGSAEGAESSAIDRKGVQRTVRAATKAKATRYIAISALGASTPTPKEWTATTEMKNYYVAKKTANKIVRNSSLFWTILEPGGLTDGKLTGKLAISEGEDIKNKNLSRADVAATVLAVLKEPKSAGHTLQMIGGSTEIAKAVKAAIKG
jgi:uncharacterized protein YbjT (DUF2867 family)